LEGLWAARMAGGPCGRLAVPAPGGPFPGPAGARRSQLPTAGFPV